LCKDFLLSTVCQFGLAARLQALARSSILATQIMDTALLHPPNMSQSPLLSGRKRIAIEPRWQPAARFSAATLPPDLRGWLTDNGSLTERLMESGQGEFSVRRLYQGWEVPLPSERKLLALPPRQLAQVREVALLLENRVVVFARSIFPIASLSGSLAHLRRLQNKSLGAILFKHPGMHRYPFELTLMEGNSDYLPESLRQPRPAWGRRCRFEIKGKKLMVSEVFLQPFTPWHAELAVRRSQRGRVSAAFMSPTQ
jgi:chorismate--pyruvate lyase